MQPVVTRDKAKMLPTVAEILRNLLIFVGAITALIVAMLIVVVKLPHTNPLKRILTTLIYRLGATAAAALFAIPAEPIHGLGSAVKICSYRNFRSNS